MSKRGKCYSNRLMGYLCCILFCVVVCCAVFNKMGIWPFGENIILAWDGYQMTGPFCYYAWDVLHGKASLFLNWDIAAGINMIGVYDLISPLNLLYWFVERNDVEIIQSILLVIRIILMAVSFLYFLESLIEEKYILKVICACIYATQVWIFKFANLNYFLDCAFYAPLLCAFIVKMFRQNKCKRWYALVLALSLLGGVQPAYMIVLFIFVFSAIQLVGIQAEERGQCVFRLGVYTLLGVGISSAFFIPMAVVALTSGRLSGGDRWVDFMNLLVTNESAVEKLQYVSGVAGVLIVINAVLFLCRTFDVRRMHGKSANLSFVFMIILLLPIYVEGIHLFWQGGSYMAFPMRGGYIIGFGMAYCLFEAFVCLDDWVSDRRMYKRILSWVSVSAIALLCLVGALENVKYLPRQPIPAEDGLYVQGEALYDGVGADKRSEARYKLFDATLYSNWGFVADLPTIGNYAHLLPTRAMETNRALGYAQDWTRLSDAGGTAFSDALLGYGYALSRTVNLDSILYKKVADVSDVTIYESNYTLPFGIILPGDYEDGFDVACDSPFETQNMISEVVLGSEILDISTYSLQSNQIRIVAPYDCAIYVYKEDMDFSGMFNRLRFTVNGEKIYCPTYLDLDNEYYATFFNDGILFLGAFEKGDNIDIDYEVDNIGEFQMAICDLELLRSESPEEVVSNIEFAKRGLRFHVNNIDEESLIYVPISNINGWRVLVNGMRCEPQTVFGDYMGIRVPAGESVVEMSFLPPGIVVGTLITALSVILLVLTWYLDICNRQYVIPKVVLRGGLVLYTSVCCIVGTIYIVFVAYDIMVVAKRVVQKIQWIMLSLMT